MKIKIIIFLVLLLALTSCVNEINNQDCVDEICFSDDCFILDIPRTQEEMMQGLMFVEYLPDDKGMLFIFQDSEKHAFWMKNTLIPIDLIWLDEQLRVVYVQTAVPCTSDPCTIYAPNTSARYTLEINAGLAEQKNIDVGREATLNLCY